MGSYARTCAVSRLAINPGDKVFWIYSTKNYCNTTYELSSSLSHQLRQLEEYEVARKKDEDFKKRFPDWKEEDFFSNFLKKYVDNPDVVFGFGEYDDYGGVEGLEIPEPEDDDEFASDNPELILIRKSVADKMAEFGRTLMRREWRDNPTIYENSYAYCVVLLAQLTRCNLYGFELLGRQYPDMDEFREIGRLQKIIKQEYNFMYREELMKTLENKWEDFCWDISYNFKKLFKKGKK